MEILNQITLLLPNTPRGSGNTRRLQERFEEVTAGSQGLMDFTAFSRAIRYPLKTEVRRKIFNKHFNIRNERGLDCNGFVETLKNLDRTTREARIDELLLYYQDEDGFVSFDDFKNIITVALQQVSFQITEGELHRLVETILDGLPRYKVEHARQILRDWSGLDWKVGEILYSALFLDPKVTRDDKKHSNRIPSISRPRSSASKSFFRCVLIAYGVLVVLLIAAVWATTWSTPFADGISCEKRWFYRWMSNLIKRNASYDIPALNEGAALFEDLEPESVEHFSYRSIVTELLNFHLFLASLLTLKSTKIALCRQPLCRYLNREDVRLLLWIVAFSISILCVTEYVLLFSRNEWSDSISSDLTPMKFLFRNRIINQIASVGILMIGITLLIRIPIIRNRLVHFTLDVGEPNLNVFIAAHLVQDESFLKWAFFLIVQYGIDCYYFGKVNQTTQMLDADFCSSNGGLILSTDREKMNFFLGDVYFLIVEQVSVSSIVPAWVISPPSDKSCLKLLLQEGHWQTKVLRQHFKNIRNEARASFLLRKKAERAAGNRKRARNPRQPSSDPSGDNGGNPAKLWPHANTIKVSTTLRARIKGPFRSVHFTEYTKYSSIMLLITPKSAGAVLAYLQHHLETESEQKIVLFFAASEFRRIEWFIASLVQLELRVMEIHQEHEDTDRSHCQSCRMFFRIYLTSATSKQDARILWVRLAMAVLSGGRPALVKHLQKALLPDMNVVSLDAEVFHDLEFLLCDADFPYADAIASLAEKAVQEIRHF